MRRRPASNQVAGSQPAQFRVALLRAQRVIRAHALHCAILEEATDRVRVLTDLALFVGTAFDGATLIDQSVDLEGDATPNLSWRDARSAAFCGADVYEPGGTLKVRQRALRLAVVILHRLVDAAISARAEDISILATLNLLQPGSQLASECDRMVRSWPAQYRALWELAFGWPGQGGRATLRDVTAGRVFQVRCPYRSHVSPVFDLG